MKPDDDRILIECNNCKETFDIPWDVLAFGFGECLQKNRPRKQQKTTLKG